MRLSTDRAWARLIATGVTLLAAYPSGADVVVTSDGSRIVGRIALWSDGKLTLETAVAGTLVIDAAYVVSIETDEPINLEFQSGDRLVGVVVSTPEGATVQTALGPVKVAPSSVTTAWRVGQEDPQTVALRAEFEAQKEAMKPKWTATLEAGGLFTEGNTDRLETRGRFDVKRTTNEDLLHFFIAADYGEQDDNRTVNEYRGGVIYENELTDRWYWYTRLQLEYDEFEQIDLRTTVAAGAGYYWIRKPEHELKNRGGFGYRHEAFNDGTADDAAVIDLGLDYRVDVAPWLQFTHSATYSPDILDFKDYRLDFDTAAVIPFQNDALKFKLGMRNEYNSRPQPGLERLDNTYYANLVLELVR